MVLEMHVNIVKFLWRHGPIWAYQWQLFSVAYADWAEWLKSACLKSKGNESWKENLS